MANGFWMVIGALVAVDAMVLTLVLRQKFKRSGNTLRKVMNVTAVHQKIAGYMNANWNGHPEQLADALRGLIPMVEDFTREQGLMLDRDAIELIVTTSLTAHKFATGAQVESALQQLREELRAAA